VSDEDLYSDSAYRRWLVSRHGRWWFLRHPRLWWSPSERMTFAGRNAQQAFAEGVRQAQPAMDKARIAKLFDVPADFLEKPKQVSGDEGGVQGE
jgi:hypothetical protein